MKAQDSVKNYTSERRMYANYAVKNIKKICKEVGPRPSGSDKELEAQKIMAEDLKTSCDEVNIESFKLAPAAFMAWVQLTVFCGVAGAVLLFLTHFFGALSLIFTAVGTGLIALGVFFVISEFLLYKQALDVFMPKKESHNVYAVRKASGETKKRIIFSGHCDSAPEWQFTYWGGPKLVTSSIAVGFGGLIYIAVVSIIGLVKSAQGADLSQNNVIWILSIVGLCLTPLFLWCLLFYNPKHPVMGANDNLSGCLCSMAVVRFMADHDIRFENTDVCVLLTGSEEAGLRGAKAFAKAHKAQIDSDAANGIQTIYVGLDTVRDFDYMGVYSKDMTGTVKNDAEVSKLLKEGAMIAGYDLPYKSVFFGSSDAAAITQGGIKGTSFAAMDPAPARYYHTRLDTADNLDLKTIEAGVGIMLETAYLYDEKGLDV